MKWKIVYLVKYDNGYYQFHTKNEEDKMSIHTDSLYRVNAECRYMLTYFNSNIEIYLAKNNWW